MADIRSFRGILFDPEIAGDFAELVAPPYDVIGPDEQERLYAASPHNVIRLDLNKEEDRYGAAAKLYREWRDGRILRRDDEPALYAYAQEYRLKTGETLERWGFFARLKVESFDRGVVLPHEHTLPSAKKDRLALQHATRANLSSIFGLYSIPNWNVRDALGQSLTNEPLCDFRDDAGIRHRFWRVTDPASSAVLVDRLDGKRVYIADGHHRYETAIRYRDEMREETGLDDGDQPFDFVLCFLVNMSDPGLVVLPTHRVFRELPLDGDALIGKLGEKFRVEEVPAAKGRDALRAALVAPEGERRLAVALAGRDSWAVLAAEDGEHDAELKGPEALRRLDVSLLHGIVLEGILGLDANEEAEAGRLVYVKDDDEALDLVESGGAAAAFLMNPTRVDEMRVVCESGERMPEKSTYFYPKILTGLVFNDLAED